MVMTDDLVPLIVKTLRDVNEGTERSLPEELGADTPLFGRNGVLDSLGLVSLVVAVEQEIERAFGLAVSLADEKAMSQTSSPYRTVGALAGYASRLISGNGGHA
jgi:D-alanine--poly(phosphoribitol) ligase subunit 2